MVDVDLVVRKQTLILRDLESLREIARMPLDEFLAKRLHQAAAERYLERIAGRMIDINYHVLTESGHPPPKDHYDSFLEMGSAGEFVNVPEFLRHVQAFLDRSGSPG